jgi:cytochrome P450
VSAADAAAFPPGPPPRRAGFVGSVAYYVDFAIDPIGFVAGRFARFGDLYYVPGPDHAPPQGAARPRNPGLFALRHPDHMIEVLVTRAAKFEKTHSAFERLSEFLGQGLLTADGDAWRRHRSLVNPAFGKKRLAGYAQIMCSEAQRTLAAWQHGEERDVGRDMMELTLRAVSRTLFQHDVGEQTDEVARAMSAFHEAIGRPDLLPSWVPTPGRRRTRRAVESLDRIIYGIIEERRRAPPTERTDLLQMLLTEVGEDGGKGLDDREVRDELVTLFLAGHETTAHALTWTWYLLAQSPHAEAELHAELDRVLGGRTPCADDLASLPYTQQVLEESMRLYPPAYIVGRRAAQDTEVGGFHVPRGSELVLWILLTHRDARWWPDPEAFRPERFAPAEVAKRPKGSYLPFGAGPRACIGKAFAMIEAQVILATLAQRFRLEPAGRMPVTVRPRITLCPAEPIRMRVVRR